MTRETEIRTGLGTIRGVSSEGITAFRRIPFAEPPVGVLRFREAVAVTPWSGTLDATAAGPICPQLPSRLSMLMGEFEAEQSEDCLTLSIWSPDPRPASRPVVVWLHGGGYSSGAGSLAWYDGERLARESGAVVVGVNYRLGALGYLHRTGVVPGNAGLSDQLEALRFVKKHIAAFGGDPQRVTAMGQSAGAHSIACLLAMPEAKGLFEQVIMLSTPFGMGLQSAEDADRVAASFFAALHIDPGHEDALAALQALPVQAILKAQLASMQAASAPGNPTPPFGPVSVGSLPPAAEFTTAAVTGSHDVRMIIGTTHEELAAFYSFDPRLQDMPADAQAALWQRLFGERADRRRNAAIARNGSSTEVQLLVDAQTHAYFEEPTLAFAAAKARGSSAAWVYRFDWRSPDPRLGACHCIELPFVLGNLEHYAQGPMLGPVDATKSRLAETVIGTISAFANVGDPNWSGIPTWQVYRDGGSPRLSFGETCRIVGDD